MIKDDNDVNALGDDDMHADDSTDDGTWTPSKEFLLSEESDEEAWVEAEMADITFQRKYIQIKSEQNNRRMKSELEREQPLRDPASVPVVNRRLFKIRLNDLLFTEHYRQLRDCVLQNRVQRMSDIDKMLRGDRVDEREAAKDDERFRKRIRDNQLLRELAITEKYLQDHQMGNQKDVSSGSIPAQEKVEQDISSNEEGLLEEW